MTTNHTRGEVILGLVPRKGRPWIEWVTIDADAARQILEAMPNQRPTRYVNVREIAKDIANGEWETTHQGIAFDENGVLLDGHHRMLAVIEAGGSIEVQATFNLPRKTFKKLDRGSVRTFGDDFINVGVTYERRESNTMAAAARIIWTYETLGNPTASDSRFVPNTDDILLVPERHPLLLETCQWCISGRGSIKFPLAPMAALLTLFREVDNDLAVDFATQLVTGEGLTKGDPAYTLREVQMNESGVRKLSRNSFMFRFVRAWNAAYEGRKVARLYSIDKTGGFPDILGRPTKKKKLAAKAEAVGRPKSKKKGDNDTQEGGLSL